MSNSESLEGTKPVDDRQRFDLAALATWLRAHVNGFGGTVQATQFRGGQSNPNFLLACSDGRRYVMRAKPGPKAKLLPSAHAIEREYRVMKALASTDFPVPRVLALCEDESVLGRAFYVMEYVQGRVFWGPALADVPRSDRAAIYDEMNRVIALLHTLDYTALGLADYGKPGNYFARQIDRWTKQYRASETERFESMENLIAWLPAHIPPSDETTLVHGDYRFDNMIFHPTEPRVLAVVDWELSTLGHPLSDFAYNCMCWHMPGDERTLLGLALGELNIPRESEYVAAYCRRTGRARIDNWEFYLAFNFFRLAGIVQGVYKRALDGTASNANALQTGRAAQSLADAGWSVVNK